MSLKNFYSLSQKDIKNLEGKTICIQEKMDMPHLWIRIDKDGVVFLRERQPITDIDRILDNTYSKLEKEFFNDNFTNDTVTNILNLCGPCDFKIYYLPNSQPYRTNYEYLYNQGKYYFLSDLWFLEKSEYKDKKFEYLDKIVNLVDCPNFINLNLSIFKWNEKCSNLLTECISQDENGYEFIYELISSFNHYSPISYKQNQFVYGFVIKTENQVWQISNDDYSHEFIDKSHSDIRAVVLSDFIEKVLSDEHFMNTLPLFIDGRKEKNYSSEQIYLDVIQKMFLYYIENTSLINNNQYKPEDFRPQLPEYINYISSLDIDLITNDTVKVICSYNRTMRELLRLLIHNFYRINAYTFYNFNEFETKKISDFLFLFS